MEFGSNTLIKEFTKAGFGIGMLTKEHAVHDIKNNKLFELEVDFTIGKKYLSLIYSTDNNRLLTKEFIKFVKNNHIQ